MLVQATGFGSLGRPLRFQIFISEILGNDKVANRETATAILSLSLSILPPFSAFASRAAGCDLHGHVGC